MFMEVETNVLNIEVFIVIPLPRKIIKQFSSSVVSYSTTAVKEP